MKDILVHTCCADCLLNTMQYLVENEQISSDDSLTVFFYNPNIHPRSEYLERLNALKEILPRVEEHIKTKLVIPSYSPKEYFSKVLPVSTKVGERCIYCWELRLKALFDYAKTNRFQYVTTTLLTSHYQNRKKIVEIGSVLEKEYKITFLKVNHLCNEKHKGFYKQNYCGCCFSLVEKNLDRNI